MSNPILDHSVVQQTIAAAVAAIVAAIAAGLGAIIKTFFKRINRIMDDVDAAHEAIRIMKGEDRNGTKRVRRLPRSRWKKRK